MPTPLHRSSNMEPEPAENMSRHAVIELTVNNHPGVMSHICGLFARRAYNVEGILCMPVGAGLQSRIWLMVRRDAKFEQMIQQVGKLEDVLEVHQRGAGRRVFEQLENYFQTGRVG